MSYVKRLDYAFNKAPTLPITTNTKYVFFSDCHRGIGTNNDNFSKNETSYLTALRHYYKNNFCYIEVGDGDELWENNNLEQIMDVHSKVFSMLSLFQSSNRLYMLFGNHDMIKKHSNDIYEAIIFHSENPSIYLRVIHGHQTDFLNSVLWKLARFLVRHLWTPLERFGIQDPTSAAKNNRICRKTEQKLTDYATNNHCLLLCGHTHKPTLTDDSCPYFNCGSCVHPNGVTCIELSGFVMKLVKWHNGKREVLGEISLN